MCTILKVIRVKHFLLRISGYYYFQIRNNRYVEYVEYQPPIRNNGEEPRHFKRWDNSKSL
jgi:hypothetical protein